MGATVPEHNLSAARLQELRESSEQEAGVIILIAAADGSRTS